MKKIICNQLGGTCNVEFYGESFEEIVEQVKTHGFNMIIVGDKNHKKVLDDLQIEIKNSGGFDLWLSKKQKEFDNLPEVKINNK